MDTQAPKPLLSQVIPFRFLPLEEKQALTQKLVPREFAPLEVIFSLGGQDQDVYLLEEGQVELIYEDWPHIKPANVVRPGHYFGERAALLNQGRTHGARALTPAKTWVLDRQEFLRLIQTYDLFAQNFGAILRDKHGIFLPLEHFIAEVSRGLVTGHLSIYRLLDFYQALEPALHPLAQHPLDLDLGALSYAVRRLPENVTSTYAYFLTDDIPATYQNPGKLFKAIPTTARRREIWEMAPGKNMVLLRTGTTDILDLISNLCLLTLEGRKLRLRLHDPAVLAQLKAGLEAQRPDPEILQDLPFSSEEQAQLLEIWPGTAAQKLYDLAIHHEDYALAVERQLNNYNFRRSEKWIVQVAKAVGQVMGREVEEFPEDWEVHIISSNTHSVTNILSPWVAQHRDPILTWARTTGHPLTRETWARPEDLVYGLLKDYYKAFPQKKPTPEEEFSWGILNLKDTASTGIQVQLIDLRKLQGRDRDPHLPPAPDQRTCLIVNIDFAFGEQAGEILRNLITLFQHRIRSVNILGKAGGLRGRRGDTLVPTAFLQQTSDDILPVPGLKPQEIQRLQQALGPDRLHQGPLLTVQGTLLQNPALLTFYQTIWRCVGLEMEGDYFARRIQQSQLLGHLGPQVRQRYFYYVSDLPLDQGENLSTPMTPGEGIPPLYAVTREVLAEIFEEAP